jgi:hypothetical protein
MKLHLNIQTSPICSNSFPISGAVVEKERFPTKRRFNISLKLIKSFFTNIPYHNNYMSLSILFLFEVSIAVDLSQWDFTGLTKHVLIF